MHDLFNNSETNLLPFDGEVVYFGKIMEQTQANFYFNWMLNNIDWKNDEAIVFGKLILTKRKVAWYGNEKYPYTYSSRTKEALPWSTELLQLKEAIEIKSGASFNSCLMNLYHDGNEGVAWHSDDEKALVQRATIASLSFGAERKFVFKHKANKTIVNTFLENGSLLLMKGDTQKNWLHQLPKTKKIVTPRISLTFRLMA